jgi:hypothetical protein
VSLCRVLCAECRGAFFLPHPVIGNMEWMMSRKMAAFIKIPKMPFTLRHLVVEMGMLYPVNSLVVARNR